MFQCILSSKLKVASLTCSMWHDGTSLTSLAHYCCASVWYWVISIMEWNWNRWTFWTSQYVILTVIFLVKHFWSAEGSYLSIIINICKLLPSWVVIITQCYNIESRPSLILLTSIIYISPHNNAIFLELIVLIHFAKSTIFSIKSFGPQILNFSFLRIKILLANLTVSNIEILVESFGFADIMCWNWIWSEDLSRVNIHMVLTNSLLEPFIFNRLFVFHCCSLSSGSRSNIVETHFF